MKKVILAFMIISTVSSFPVLGQQEVALYTQVPNSKPEGIPERTEVRSDGVKLVHHVSNPTLTIYKAKDKGRGGQATPAMIICPGGGYQYLAIDKEGMLVAEALAEWGITALVLKYRLPDTALMEETSIGPLQDAQRAIQWVRANADAYHIDPEKVGIMGFSAGGHLASTLSTHYSKPEIPDPEGISLRPDFSVLIYPVISFSDSLTHKGSRTRLIGTNPDKQTIQEYSNELQVTSDTPPAFLVHAKDDKTVPWQNTARYMEALEAKDVDAGVVYYPSGGHGFGMYNASEKESWMPALKRWLKTRGVLEK